jgi:hypothetical protein
MAKHGRHVRIFFEQFRLSAHMHSFSLTHEAPAEECTVFESVTKQFTPDAAGGNASCEGYYRGTEEDADAYLGEALGSDTQANLMIAPEGWSAVGKRVFMMLCDVTKKSAKTIATALVSISADFLSSSGVNTGVILHPREAEAATGAEGTYHDHGAATANGAVAQLHVEEASEVGDESLVSVVQHSADHAVWVDLITFDAASAPGTQRKSVAGAVNRYTRERHAVAGSAPSFTYAVGFSRLKPSQV